MYLKRILLIVILFTISGCNSSPSNNDLSKLDVGVVSYGKSKNYLEQYSDLKNYLGGELNSLIEIEPVFNEVKALEQISRKRWDVVFAPPGLAAIAISQHNYEPILPLEGGEKSRSVIVVRQDAPLTERNDLAGQTIALGQKGSATGYYLPLYNLYGLNFEEILFAATPQQVLQWLDEGKVAAGALSLAQYNLYRRNYAPNTFKVLHLDNHDVPPGAILVSDRVDRNLYSQIIIKLVDTPSFISASAGYLPKGKLPDYGYMIRVIERVQEISPMSVTQ